MRTALLVETACFKCDAPIDIEFKHDKQTAVIFCPGCGHGIRYRLTYRIELDDAIKPLKGINYDS